MELTHLTPSVPPLNLPHLQNNKNFIWIFSYLELYSVCLFSPTDVSCGSHSIMSMYQVTVWILSIKRGCSLFRSLQWNWFICSFIICIYFLPQMSHAAATALCWCIKLQCEFYPSREAALCLGPYCVALVLSIVNLYVFFFLPQMSHAAATALCRCIKLQCEFYPSREAALCLDPYSGIGFALWCLCR